jgi:tetratricopeptide (TPR) repeat protein
MGFWAISSLAGEVSAPTVSARAQGTVAELIQNALGPYRDEDDFRGATNSSSLRNLTNIETNFRQASALMPSRLDLRFGIASALLLQALQTNSQFDLKIRDAIAIYQQTRALDTNGFEASILLAAYTRAIGESNAAAAAFKQVQAIDPQRTEEYLERLRRADEILETKMNTEPSSAMPTNREHAIIVLGAALETNGTIKVKLSARLQQALKLARMYPEAPIVVTGGNQKCGITEAYAMSLWFQSQGICTNRLYLEDQARDTIGNAVFSSSILKKLGITHVTLVTSANHIRAWTGRSCGGLSPAGLAAQLWPLGGRGRAPT